MDDYYIRIYRANEEHLQKFNELYSGLLKNKIKFHVERSGYSDVEYENFISAVNGKLFRAQKINETTYSEKILKFYQIIIQSIDFLESAEFMHRIFKTACLKHINEVKSYSDRLGYSDYEELMKEVNSQMVKLEDFPYYVISLDDIFYLNSNWIEFPDNLLKHKWKIKKIIYKSLQLSMIRKIKYFYSSDNKFFGKWKKRDIRFFPDTDTLRTIEYILFHCSSSDNCNTDKIKDVLDRVLERAYAKNPKGLLKRSPIDLEFILRDIREGTEMPEVEELIHNALFSKEYLKKSC